MGRERRLWLVVPPVILCMIDQIVTLARQPLVYWAGRFEYGREGCPPYAWLMTRHPLAFEAGIAGWIAMFAAVILLAPIRWSRAISMAIVIGHSWGLCTWLIAMSNGYWLCILLILGSGVLTSVFWERSICPVPVPSAQDGQLRKFRKRLALLVGVLLVALVAQMGVTLPAHVHFRDRSGALAKRILSIARDNQSSMEDRLRQVSEVLNHDALDRAWTDVKKSWERQGIYEVAVYGNSARVVLLDSDLYSTVFTAEGKITKVAPWYSRDFGPAR